MKDKDIIIHKTAIIKRPVWLTMSDHIAIDPFFYMTTGAKIGNYVHIGSHVSVIGGAGAELIIGNNVAISTGCRLVCRSNDFWSKKSAVPFSLGEKDLYGSFIQIGNNVILGANVVVLPDVIIGEGARVGANSLVKEDLAPRGVYVGSPARFIGETYD